MFANRLAQLDVDIIRAVNRPDICPISHLPWLAWALSVDNWNPHWSESVKRQVVANSLQVHKTKGTFGAVRRALQALNITADIEEWFDVNTDPHTFKLTAWTQGGLGGTTLLDATIYQAIRQAVDAAKPLRSHYTFRAGVKLSSSIRVGGCLRSAQVFRATFDSQTQLRQTVAVAGIVQTATVARITMDAAA